MKDYVKALGDIAKALTSYFNPNAYEARVLRGLVGTGDKMREYSDKVYNRARAAGVSPEKKEMKYLRHYIRKWKADRLKLR